MRCPFFGDSALGVFFAVVAGGVPTIGDARPNLCSRRIPGKKLPQ
jgi:hypothetical protein